MRETFYQKYSREAVPDEQLFVHERGWEICKAGHSYGPAIRDYYILHFIPDGKGVYEIDGREHRLTKNQMFLIPPEKETLYYADGEDPWFYYWVGFKGKQADKLLRLGGLIENGVYTASVKDVQRMLQAFKSLCKNEPESLANSFMMTGNLYIILSILIDSYENYGGYASESYVSMSVRFMQENYREGVTVQDVVDYLNIDRAHFCRIFKAKMSVSPSEYLQSLKIYEAKRLLEGTDMSLIDLSVELGFSEYANFSRLFKKKIGLSPKEYKSLINEKISDAVANPANGD